MLKTVEFDKKELTKFNEGYNWLKTAQIVFTNKLNHIYKKKTFNSNLITISHIKQLLNNYISKVLNIQHESKHIDNKQINSEILPTYYK